MKQCYVFRTHKIDSIDKEQVEEYATELAGYCDFFVCLNVKDRSDTSIVQWWNEVCSSIPAKLVVFYESDIYAYASFYRGAWLHSQYCFTAFYQQVATYDYYWFIEYDARISGSVKEILQHHVATQADLLGTHVMSYLTYPEWSWWIEEHSKLSLPLEQRYSYFAALSRLSSRLLKVLVEAVKQEYAMVETFVPTICVQKFGKECVHNLDAQFWINVDYRKMSTEVSTTVICAEVFGKYPEYRLNIKPTGKVNNKLYHPVKNY